jgi:hypothetical protein
MNATLSSPVPISGEELRVSSVPRLIFLSTGLLFVAGIVAAAAWSSTGDMRWLRFFFTYPGSLFLVGCSSIQLWLAFRCWRQFSPGDLLRPAWLLITLAALLQLSGGLLLQWLGLESRINPLALLPASLRDPFIRGALNWGELSGPLYMVLLACGLFYVLRACRQIGVLGHFERVDFVLLGVVLVYTLIFFWTVVFSPRHGGRILGLHAFISWTSDPLLCLLLFQAVLIRRSAANLGWGLVSRCWMCFTAAIFLTSVGDIGLWASSKGYLPHFLEVVSWYIWFLPSAAYALGPAYQSQAMLGAMRGHLGEPVYSRT